VGARWHAFIVGSSNQPVDDIRPLHFVSFVPSQTSCVFVTVDESVTSPLLLFYSFTPTFFIFLFIYLFIYYFIFIFFFFNYLFFLNELLHRDGVVQSWAYTHPSQLRDSDGALLPFPTIKGLLFFFIFLCFI
jgi:hypothetical protein